VSTYDRTTDNYISATSSSKSTDYHKQASKQAIKYKGLRTGCLNKVISVLD